MSARPRHSDFPAHLDNRAASWVLRRARGLTTAEERELAQWIAADPRHVACLARHQGNWARLGQLVADLPPYESRPDRDLLAPPTHLRLRPLAVSLAAAALVAIGFFWWQEKATPRSAPVPAVATLTTIEQRTLEDGSVVELNRGAEVSVAFTPGERRVRLEHGEAHFIVTKDATRPFIVSAGGLDVRAVGTAFNVRLDSLDVEVLVTEGRVQVVSPVPPNREGAPMPGVPVLEPGQRTRVSREPAGAPAEVVAASSDEIEQLLAWRPRKLDFTAAPLAAILAEFNRRNPVHLRAEDPRVTSLRLSASLRSDNVDGFVRLLEARYGIRAERTGNTITLSSQ